MFARKQFTSGRGFCASLRPLLYTVTVVKVRCDRIDMSFFAKAFGGGKMKKEAATAGEAVRKLMEKEEMLEKKQKFLEDKIAEQLDIARKHATKNKRGALQALKRKKQYEKQLTQVDNTLSTIECQREALENANNNMEVLKIMSAAADALKATQQNVDVEDIHKLMDDIAEQQEIANEISGAVSKPVEFGTLVDEDELEKELEDLEQEELTKQLLDIEGPSTAKLPSPPTTEVNKPDKPKQQDEDDDITELLQWAS